MPRSRAAVRFALALALTAWVGAEASAGDRVLMTVGPGASIQAAIDELRAVGGGTVLLLPGVYSEPLCIGSGVVVRGVAGSARTILDGSAGARGEDSGHPADGGVAGTMCDGPSFIELSEGTLEGVTVRNAGSPTARGGAVRIVGQGDIVDCAFDANEACVGGAVFLDGWPGSGTSHINGCTFADNSASFAGAIGTIFGDLEVVGCLFLDNTAAGGSFEPFPGLGGPAGGGAVHLHQPGTTIFRDCRFIRNIAPPGEGGAISCGYLGWQFEVEQCIFVDNGASGGEAIVLRASSVQVRSCAFLNDGGLFGLAIGGMTDGPLWLENSILWGDGPGPRVAFLWPPFVDSFARHCDIRGSGGSGPEWSLPGIEDQGGNIDAYPLWLNFPGLELSPVSPCVDAGDATILPPTLLVDIAGLPRVADGNGDGIAEVDMGPRERQQWVDPDLDGDGCVDGTDLGILLAVFGAPGGLGDLTADGTVDGADLGALLGSWAPCPVDPR